ncbi:hypothetical protein [Bifidobacterium stellenboschense]|uniref:Uncharacterized protein n=1 Tax=Bifidobacterium stellenboschense TaxID=762211 RepID=A0A087DQP8_9BIFI|nr:hypothetical protein [Bifidobacterium stellenboschense]KFI97848.1 hypothetical protein BSTEL_0659 [Bifidobacterium stellenboschense]
MDAHEYGRHCSGYRKPDPRRWERWPYTTRETLLLAIAVAASFAWLMTHDGLLHPVANTVALVVYALAGGLLLLPCAVRALALAGFPSRMDGGEGAGDERR